MDIRQISGRYQMDGVSQIQSVKYSQSDTMKLTLNNMTILGYRQ